MYLYWQLNVSLREEIFLYAFFTKAENCYIYLQFIKCGIPRLCFKLVDGPWMTKTFIRLSRHVRCLAFACEDRQSPLRKMVEEIGIGLGSCFKILTKNVVIWYMATKFIQRLVTVEEKFHLHRPLTAGWSSRRLMKLTIWRLTTTLVAVPPR